MCIITWSLATYYMLIYTGIIDIRNTYLTIEYLSLFYKISIDTLNSYLDNNKELEY